jgi:hypothetical protein
MEVCRSELKMLLGACILLSLFTVVAQPTGMETAAIGMTNNPKIPKMLRPDGKLTHEAFIFTTKAYEREALRLVIEEANKVAKELQLPEKLPITETNLTRAFIVGYGMSFLPPGMIGNVHTRDYGYFVSVGHKLSFVEGAHQDGDCMNWRQHYRWPVSRIDTNGAYQLATQWLAAASMDVNGLNRDCQLRIEPNSYWNSGVKKGMFVPIYDVFWISPQNKGEGFGNVASVTLFAPTKTLVSLRVQDSRYILRKPLVFTNLDFLLSQTNVSVDANSPRKQ